MSNERPPDLSLFLDILQTLEAIDSQASALGQDVVELWQAVKEAARRGISEFHPQRST